MPRKQVGFMIDSKVHKALSTVARYHDNNFATQAELVNHAIECVINQLAVDDPLARAALDAELDHRTQHSCYGGLCIKCRHVAKCRAGSYTDGYAA
jgi:hypothetical protein